MVFSIYCGGRCCISAYTLGHTGWHRSPGVDADSLGLYCEVFGHSMDTTAVNSFYVYATAAGILITFAPACLLFAQLVPLCMFGLPGGCWPTLRGLSELPPAGGSLGKPCGTRPSSPGCRFAIPMALCGLACLRLARLLVVLSVHLEGAWAATGAPGSAGRSRDFLARRDLFIERLGGPCSSLSEGRAGIQFATLNSVPGGVGRRCAACLSFLPREEA